MATSELQPPRPRAASARQRAAHPATLALGAAIVTQIASAPGQTVGISVFVGYLVTGLDLSRSAISGAYLVGTLAGAFSMPLTGRLIDRRGLRWSTISFGLCFGAALVAMSGVHGLPMLVVGFAGTRILGQGALTLLASTSVAVWFDRSRGTALGVFSAVAGAGMSLVPLASTVLIAWFGWRGTWIVLGVLVWLVLLPLGYAVVRNPPVAAKTPPRGADRPARRHLEPARWELRDVRREPAFWILTAAVTLAALVVTGLVFHQIVLLHERGLSDVQAAGNFIPQTIATAVAALTAGRMVDRFAPRWILSGSIALLGVAPLAVLHVTGPATAAMYGIVLGAAGGAIRTVEAAVLPRWFGLTQIGELRGIVMAATVAGSALGPAVLSLSHDTTGSYVPALVCLAVVAVTLAALAAPTKAPVGAPVPHEATTYAVEAT